MVLTWPKGKRAAWLIGALGLMLASAYSIFESLAVATNMSDRIGFPQFAIQVPGLEAEALRWGWLGLSLLLLAALLLGLGRSPANGGVGAALPAARTNLTYPVAAREWLSPAASYLRRLAVSVLGTFGFLILLLLLMFLRAELGTVKH
ncbi:MAG: hypothetical protein KGL59_14595 [Acidobacteriota bacterium]|nr:hypothetical protein [Acidobacteriota bacterium]